MKVCTCVHMFITIYWMFPEEVWFNEIKLGSLMHACSMFLLTYVMHIPPTLTKVHMSLTGSLDTCIISVAVIIYQIHKSCN